MDKRLPSDKTGEGRKGRPRLPEVCREQMWALYTVCSTDRKKHSSV